MSNIPKMGHLTTPVFFVFYAILSSFWVFSRVFCFVCWYFFSPFRCHFTTPLTHGWIWGSENMGLSENVVYPMTQWFCWSLSLWNMAISLGILTQHFQTYPYSRFPSTSQLWVIFTPLCQEASRASSWIATSSLARQSGQSAKARKNQKRWGDDRQFDGNLLYWYMGH